MLYLDNAPAEIDTLTPKVRLLIQVRITPFKQTLSLALLKMANVV